MFYPIRRIVCYSFSISHTPDIYKKGSFANRKHEESVQDSRDPTLSQTKTLKQYEAAPRKKYDNIYCLALQNHNTQAQEMDFENDSHCHLLPAQESDSVQP